jgi:hypothetical protein
MPKKTKIKSIKEIEAKGAVRKDHSELKDKLALSGIIIATSLVFTIAAAGFVYFQVGNKFNTAAGEISTLMSASKATDEKVVALETKVNDAITKWESSQKPVVPAPSGTEPVNPTPAKVTLGDKELTLVPTASFSITENLVSNNKKQVVYLETNGAAANLMIQSATGAAKKLAEKTDTAVSWKLFKWSKNDVKVIVLEKKSGQATGTYRAVDAVSGKISDLAAEGALFYENFRKLITVEAVPNTPYQLCQAGPNGEKNFGKIMLKNIETAAFLALKTDPASYYTLKEIDKTETTLTYTERKLVKQGECYVIDPKIQEQTLTYKLK